MTQLILHHYPNSPVAENIRLVLGFPRLGFEMRRAR
jgi:hypothetical protein